MISSECYGYMSGCVCEGCIELDRIEEDRFQEELWYDEDYLRDEDDYLVGGTY